ncbi:hypothetical protein DPMN_120496 [Dreissena polymorpha]|uniref:Uncharacterized protein n=1 Tax=Dreissena polymorpha TaxID=45954 RepID=A0A9D4GKK5_DREPO|nr:hypothetical protein DPMN_120496 [Dreissena polymorpha]
MYYDVHVDLASYRRRRLFERPPHPLYASQDVRLASFTNSPSHLQARGQTLAEAGFFYVGRQEASK